MVRELIRKKIPLLSIAIVSIVVVTACGETFSEVTSSEDADSATRNGSVQSSSLPEITGISGWINSEHTSVEAEIARGNVVLIDFWTYTCINCLRTMPYLKAWHEKYSDNGLIILGIHSPEFEFEQDPQNVQNAVDRIGVPWAVALDNDMETWGNFGNHFWPAKYLFGPDNNIVYSHFGEGDYAETELAIREQLKAAGHDITDIPFDPLPTNVRHEVTTRQTRELYGGYHRAYSQQGIYNGHEDYYSGPDQKIQYQDPGDTIDGKYFLMGPWENRSQSIVHGREDPSLEDYLRVPFKASSVNIVVEPAGPEPFDVVVDLEGTPLTVQQAGKDIVFKDDGTTILEVSEPRMYAVLDSPKFLESNLFFRSTSDNFAVFAFTFGKYLKAD